VYLGACSYIATQQAFLDEAHAIMHEDPDDDIPDSW